ncbi:flagellar export protein FliJ [Saccharibacillus sp. CPCC 101409]|uniref:flagellar export protein FliJ n=1 Tax=Saccharibacillus sp. CPCC 101409 TaxID=3058041 RepID=UPI0026728F6B|nr:flagellar export protein FliJ [Saccharibacillus sp. CPCC 101409]MDO3410700.1 flagellar export protein FliJ [Saccharibacillus sp. CPCC 101409]
MKFNYAFQKVVDLKTSEKNHAEMHLSSALGVLQAEEQTLGQLFSSKDAAVDSIQDQTVNAVSASQLQQMQDYIQYIDQCILKKRQDIQTAQVKVEEKKEHLTTKMLDEKVWLQARGKALEGFQKEELQREQGELDEMATVRYAASRVQ